MRRPTATALMGGPSWRAVRVHRSRSAVTMRRFRITSRWSLVSYGTGNVDPETARSLIEHVGLEILPSLQAKYEKKVVVDLADFGAILETLEEVPLELYECESAQVCFIRSPFTGDALMAIFRFGSSETLEKMTQEPIDSDFETGPTTALTIFCDAIGEFLLKGDQLSVSDAVGPVVDFAYKKIQRFTIADFGIIGRDIIWPPMDADGDGISEN